MAEHRVPAEVHGGGVGPRQHPPGAAAFDERALAQHAVRARSLRVSARPST
ncbi:hypothetical protein ACFPM0_10395 [Pseudonocardia sulfidoxydans]|uniref:hypothetical protein n=1 Tax=Pseudonocardia sulfidoxydans TaxID=54011 RepID=UPI00361564FF